MNEMTEFKVRKMAGDKLGFDLSSPEPKKFVRQVVESFLLSQQQAQEEEEEEEPVVEEPLSNKRRVTIQDFRGKTLVSIREYYEKDGKQLPSSKGISLTAEQWSTFRKAVPTIEESIKKVESRLR
ncbi:hypothetical protein IFM89_029661 [Coptis chinensis]|uniref:RNA polymerase II transcriptional coactivator KELP n=1 Tax=Coptis chinensis TaxID=261450 RepID=A0A835IH93_9MAGN|nr:hypothetical protein IFM89_029661 [Coptis chinensis]